MTSSADPYIGDESTTVPPWSKKVLSTSARPSRRRRLLPTLKVIHIPIPITGIRSAVPGIARSMAGPDIAGPVSQARVSQAMFLGGYRRGQALCRVKALRPLP